MTNNYSDISIILKSAAQCVRASVAARSLASATATKAVAMACDDDGDEGIDCGSVMQAINDLPVTLVCEAGADVTQDLVVANLGENVPAGRFVIIGVVRKNGACILPEIISFEKFNRCLRNIDPDIFLPVDDRYWLNQTRTMVFAGETALQMAASLGGMQIVCGPVSGGSELACRSG